MSSHALATQTSGDLRREKMASRLVKSSLCANYPIGHQGLFRQWMKVNHPGELLWHVGRAASGGRQDVASMAALAIFWNRNYCIDFLDKILTYGDAGAKDNILANNLWILLSSVEMVAVA